MTFEEKVFNYFSEFTKLDNETCTAILHLEFSKFPHDSFNPILYSIRHDESSQCRLFQLLIDQYLQVLGNDLNYISVGELFLLALAKLTAWSLQQVVNRFKGLSASSRLGSELFGLLSALLTSHGPSTTSTVANSLSQWAVVELVLQTCSRILGHDAALLRQAVLVLLAGLDSGLQFDWSDGQLAFCLRCVCRYHALVIDACPGQLAAVIGRLRLVLIAASDGGGQSEQADIMGLMLFLLQTYQTSTHLPGAGMPADLGVKSLPGLFVTGENSSNWSTANNSRQTPLLMTNQLAGEALCVNNLLDLHPIDQGFLMDEEVEQEFEKFLHNIKT